MTREPYYRDEDVTVYHGESLDVLRDLPANSVDAVVTDPPYGLAEHPRKLVDKALRAWLAGDREHVPDGRGFMGRRWDAFVPPPALWDEVLRVLKPGGHVLAFAASRTADLMGMSMRLGGYTEADSLTMRDAITWHYASGMPKSRDVSKDLDRMAGAEREVVGEGYRVAQREGTSTPLQVSYDGAYPITAPASEAAKRWAGWGTGLKPASEPILVGRKTFRGTVAANLLEHGTGAINVDGCRTEMSEEDREKYERGAQAWVEMSNRRNADGTKASEIYGVYGNQAGAPKDGGRWPANVVFTHAAGPDGEDLCADGCVEGCPVHELDRQSGVTTSVAGVPRSGSSGDGWRTTHTGAEHNDSGGASRYFPTFRYGAKASGKERPRIGGGTGSAMAANRCALCGKQDLSGSRCECPVPEWVPRGGDDEVIAHPTVKPVELMRWLVRLVCPPGGVVLDPFVGSGTTLEACIVENMRGIGIEREEKHARLIAKRMSKAMQPALDLGDLGGM